MQAHERNTAAFVRWFLVWTTAGCVFALQLRWYYELSWPLSIFWGLADWYLWGMLALLLGTIIRRPDFQRLSTRVRAAAYLLSAPLFAALHVVLTILVGGSSSLPSDMSWIEFSQALYAKKLTLNLITFAVIVVIYEQRVDRVPRRKVLLSAKLGDTTRLLTADEIIWGEVCGNYVNLHTEDGVWPVRDTLTDLLGRLHNGQFVKTSRSCMISLKSVHRQNSEDGALSLTLSDGTELRVARRQRARVRQALREFHLHDQQA